jgi:serine/threonine protein kinase
MPASPPPLAPGFLVGGRYRIERTLGRGAFGISYLAWFEPRREHRVLKELAPAGSQRGEDGLLSLNDEDGLALVAQFLDEASVLRRLRAPHVLPALEAFRWGETAFCATDWIEGALSLDQVLAARGPLVPRACLKLARDLLETLETVHREGLLHHDIKPSNIICAPDGEFFLIDFGAAREWTADRTGSHPLLFTPAYAPIEQMASRARRGPGSDLYSWAATLCHAATGEPPPSALDRAAGAHASAPPSLPDGLRQALEACLKMQLGQRPRSAADVRRILDAPVRRPLRRATLSELEAKRAALKAFRWSKGSCPECEAELTRPSPHAAGTCAVCREGDLTRRHPEPESCPVCRRDRLTRVKPQKPVTWCPGCRTGRLEISRSLLGRKGEAHCPDCGWAAPFSGAGFAQEDGELSFADAEKRAGRAAQVDECAACGSQFDHLPRGRRRKMSGPASPGGYVELHAEEWAMIAAGFLPDQGGLFCASCGADWHESKQGLTLLEAPSHDPFGFAAAWKGRLLSPEGLPWIAVGKTSGRPGPLCPSCGFEADDAPKKAWTLVHAASPRLTARLGDSLAPDEWRRVALDLPLPSQMGAFEEELAETYADSIRTGTLAMDPDRPEELWRSRAEVVGFDPDAEWKRKGRVILVADAEGLLLKGGLSQRFWPWSELSRIRWQGSEVQIEPVSSGGIQVDIPLLELEMESGFVVELRAEDFAAICQRRMG